MLYIGNERLKPKVNETDARFITEAYYDTEIEYLESSGTQLINTKIIGGTNCEYEIKFQLTSAGSTWPHVCGSNHPPTFPKVYNQAGIKMQYKPQGASGTGTIYSVGNQDYIPHIVEYKNGLFLYDGVEKANIGPNGISDYPFCIFWYLAEPTVTKGMLGRIYYCKLWKDHVLVRDLIPVRVGSVGYMYDKVSKQLFGNYYAGDFILGPDKEDQL